MDLDKMKQTSAKTITLGIKELLEKGLFKWVDTGNVVSFDELLNMHGASEPLGYNEAKNIFPSLSNDSRIKKFK